MVFINHTRKFIYIGNAKTGSTSIYIKLKALCAKDDYEFRISEKPYLYHMGIEDVLKNRPELENYKRYGFVRNPHTRFMSIYLDGKTSSGHIKEWSRELLNYPTYENFCSHFHETKIKTDIHFRSCFKGMSINGVLAMDFIGKFETLQIDFDKMCEMIGLEGNTKLPVCNKTNHGKVSDSDINAFINELYKDDIEAFY